MKIFVILLIAAAIAWGFIDDNGCDSSIPSGTLPQGTDVINLSVVNTFQVSTASHILGLDHQQSIAYLGLMDNMSDSIRGVSDSDGSPFWTIHVSYGNTFGLTHTWPVPYGWYVNSWSSSDMYFYQTGVWSTAFTNPAGINGRGMDYNNDTDMIWETDGGDGVWRINPYGSGTYYATPEAPGQLSGLAVFPFHGNLGIALCTYNVPGWFIYEFDGANLVYYGSADLGLTSFTSSHGLTYNPSTDTFYYSYVVYGNMVWVAEVGWTETSLDQNTWGAIKASF